MLFSQYEYGHWVNVKSQEMSSFPPLCNKAAWFEIGSVTSLWGQSPLITHMTHICEAGPGAFSL